MALFSRAREMAAALAGEIGLIIKPTKTPKIINLQTKQIVFKTPKTEKTPSRTKDQAERTTKSSTSQTPLAGKNDAATAASTSKVKEEMQPLTYSRPVNLPKPLPLELFPDEESTAMEADSVIALPAPAPVAELVVQPEDKVSQTEDKAAEPKADAAVPRAKAETPAKQPETKTEADKKPPAAEGGNAVFADLFGKMEVEEETPMDRLMNSLTTITMEEVQSEAAEVQGLMNEWAQSQAPR